MILEIDDFDIGIVVKGKYDPGRPMPRASSTDSDNWPDPGDGEEMEWDAFFVVSKDDHKIEVPVPDEFINFIKDTVDNSIKKSHADEIHDAQMNVAYEKWCNERGL